MDAAKKVQTRDAFPTNKKKGKGTTLPPHTFVMFPLSNIPVLIIREQHVKMHLY